MAKQSILDQYEIGATVQLSGNVAELTVDPQTQSYKVRDQNNQGIKYQEQRLRIQLNSGGYLTAWFIVPPFFEELRQPVNFNGEVQEYRGTRFLVACKMDSGSSAMSQPAPTDPPKPPQGGTEDTKEEKVDWDAKDKRQARMNGLNNATRLVCLLAEINKDATFCSTDTIKATAAEFVDYIYDGLDTHKKADGSPNF